MSTAKSIIKKGKEQAVNLIEIDNRIFTECLNYIAGTKEGMYVLNRLMCNCGQKRSSIVRDNDGCIDSGSVEYMEGKRSIWLHDLERYMNDNSLKKVMFLNRRQICQQKTTIQEKM